MALTETVFIGDDNQQTITVTSSTTATPFAGVTRMTCDLQPAGVTIDSDTAPTAITWNDTQVTFDIGDTAATGVQKATLRAYDAGHPDGQRITDPQGDDAARLTFNFI